MNIRTKWHRARELLEAGQVWMTAEKGKMAKTWDEVRLDMSRLSRFFELCESLPKFVIDNATVGLVTTKDAGLSLLAMKQADALRLPFPAMVVEIVHSPRFTTIVILADRQSGENDKPFREAPDKSWQPPVERYPFYGVPFAIQKDDGGEYLVCGYSMSYCGLTEAPSKSDPEKLGPWLATESAGVYWLPNDTNDRDLEKLISSQVDKDVRYTANALYTALLLLMTQGMEREVVEATKLNKHRVASGKPPIPRHTYIHIGKVYRSATGDRSDDYDPRRSPIPHWRRGHNVTYGTGPAHKGGKVVRYIPPRIVALKKDTVYTEDELPKMPTYRVTQ